MQSRSALQRLERCASKDCGSKLSALATKLEMPCFEGDEEGAACSRERREPLMLTGERDKNALRAMDVAVRVRGKDCLLESDAFQHQEHYSDSALHADVDAATFCMQTWMLQLSACRRGCCNLWLGAAVCNTTVKGLTTTS